VGYSDGFFHSKVCQAAPRIAENLASVETVLDDEDIAAIAKLDKHRRYVDGKIFDIGGPYTIENIWDEKIEDRYN
jgi:alcohol dehydrogenase (NADP+)